MATKKPGLDPAPRLSVRDRTLDVLRRRIISLELPPGAPLSENELAQELGVSRTPVRESLILLREEGLIQVFPQIGSFVSLVDLERVAQAQFIREAIECASLADVVAGPDGVSGLREILQAQWDAEAEGDIDRFFRLDEDFHRELLQLAGHGAAWNAVNSAKAHLDRARRLSLIDSGHVATLIGQHTAVVDGLAKDDHAAADSSLRLHLRGVFKDIERIQGATPELFSDGSAPRASRRSVARLS
ncbi:DNA-binding GntR family transcriptional regulator [Paenarthrobacter nitroguajacolicus]|uniref:GntR family transcriptional regulator n=1 Tax=Paenarthrobacter nitroguajacolicus TaxID=211146 RepID=UPI00285D42D8|nr:GntR family transcriptional regulator [Paenarthrobacter nitroguajacolicus]MDR6987488.1 DNA-binding GntR family transcriptional regulator [Paenarthrobacter nitroguajacolicus]